MMKQKQILLINMKKYKSSIKMVLIAIFKQFSVVYFVYLMTQ